MPTTRPRYTITDTGKLRHALDVAQTRWPGRPRRELLELLAEQAAARLEVEMRLERRREFLAELPALVDVDVLLSDEAWR